MQTMSLGAGRSISNPKKEFKATDVLRAEYSETLTNYSLKIKIFIIHISGKGFLKVLK